MKKFVIDPRFQISYSSYYIRGMMDLFPSKVRFSCLEGLTLYDYEDYRCGFAFEAIYNDGERRRVFVDTGDSNAIREKFYGWADRYAKINVKQEDRDREKLLLIGPSFGIRLWNPFETLIMAIINYMRARHEDGYLPSLKLYLKDYLYMIVRRLPLSSYSNNSKFEQNDYVFTLNTLWYDPLTDGLTNKMRGAFILSCKKLFSKFEGGFRIIDNPEVIRQFPRYKDYYLEYKDVITTQRVNLKEYLEKTKKSFLVFNVPSVSGCHGWKLGEYFALGKIIISAPLINEIPDKQLFSKCIYQVDNENDILNAVEYLSKDVNRREKMRKCVKEYYETWLSPKVVILQLISR